MAVLVVWLARSAQVAPPRADAPSPLERAQPLAPVAPAPEPRLARDPFRYLGAPARVDPVPKVARPSEPAVVATPSTAEAVRLAGFVRIRSQLKAVLSIAGTTIVAAPGETVEGYQVLSVDEDAGVRVRSPSGEELLLHPAAAR